MKARPTPRERVRAVIQEGLAESRSRAEALRKKWEASPVRYDLEVAQHEQREWEKLIAAISTLPVAQAPAPPPPRIVPDPIQTKRPDAIRRCWKCGVQIWAQSKTGACIAHKNMVRPLPTGKQDGYDTCPGRFKAQGCGKSKKQSAELCDSCLQARQLAVAK